MHILKLASFFALLLPLPIALTTSDTFAANLQTTAVILDIGKCSFTKNTPGPFFINFAPALDPFIANDRSSSINVEIACVGLGNKPSTIIIKLNTASPLALDHEFLSATIIPFSLNLPQSKAATNNNPVSFTITATILGGAYQNKPSGNYSRSVILDVLN
jgi:hypothetical protein